MISVNRFPQSLGCCRAAWCSEKKANCSEYVSMSFPPPHFPVFSLKRVEVLALCMFCPQEVKHWLPYPSLDIALLLHSKQRTISFFHWRTKQASLSLFNESMFLTFVVPSSFTSVSRQSETSCYAKETSVALAKRCTLPCCVDFSSEAPISLEQLLSMHDGTSRMLHLPPNSFMCVHMSCMREAHERYK